MLKYAQEFADFLDEKNLHYEARDFEGGSRLQIRFDKNGIVFLFSGDDGRYVSMYTTIETVPADKIADVLIVCNELNAKYKWLKFYIDDDNDVLSEDDAILNGDSAADECFELMLRRLNILDEVRSPIMRAIYA